MFGDKKQVKVHFIGIGGIGMSGIAQVLLQMGYRVSGSDVKESPTLGNLRNFGAEIFLGHKKENLSNCTVVVYSSAVTDENPEMLEAFLKGIPRIRRAEMLAEIMRTKFGVAVAGTHGKTTTTSFLSTILYECELDPTLIIGGVVKKLGGNARVGQGEILVAEADESDGSFLLFNPIMSVITNIDDDHMEFYKTEENLYQAFLDFANRIPFYGCCALNIHDPQLNQIRKKMNRPWVSFGLSPEADYDARDIESRGSETQYQLYYKGELATNITINLPGRHNILNSLGAISIAHQMGLSFSQIAKAIVKFEGVGRRFETLYTHGGFRLIDDYAHHPTEISSTLEAVKQLGKKQVVVFFEPHRYTRTQSCWKDFLHCFNEASKIYIGPIYAASELEIPGVTGERLVHDINELHPDFATYVDSIDHIDQLIEKYHETETIFMTLGAGSIGKKVRDAVSTLKKP